MSTKAYYTHEEIGKGKPGFSKTRSIIEAAFYGNNAFKIILRLSCLFLKFTKIMYKFIT